MTFSNYDPLFYENDRLRVEETEIPGLLFVHLVVRPDFRGWSKEAFQKRDLVALGFPEDFTPVQSDVTSNELAGVTRGIHVEAVAKYISLTRGLAFAAFVDVRDGPTFGAIRTVLLTPALGVLVPRGVGNSYQTLTDDVQYSYLIGAYRPSGSPVAMVNASDPALAIEWPIPLERAYMADYDRGLPGLAGIVPVRM